MKKFAKASFAALGCLGTLALAVAAGLWLLWQQAEKAAGVYEPWSRSDGTVLADLRYGDGARNVFDLYLPAGIGQRDSVAVMLFVHGGGWIAGDKKDVAYACKRYAKRGYATAALNYTLLDSTRQGNLPRMLREMQACAGQVRQELEQRGVRPARMALGGVSAGGHLAMLYAWKCARCSPIPVAFVAQQVGPSDLSLMFPVTPEDFRRAEADSLKHKEIENLVFNVCGEEMRPEWRNPRSVDSLLRSVSPVYCLDSCSVPGVFAYGEKDWLVPVGHAQRLEAACDSFGIDYHSFRFPHSDHLLAFDPGQQQAFSLCVQSYARRYFGY